MTATNAVTVSRTKQVFKWLTIIILLAVSVALVWFWIHRPPPPNFGDVSYAPQSEAQKLDIYLPEGKGPFPVVVYLHGGAFKFGNKRDYFGDFKGNIAQMRGAGIALVSVEYRMSGEAVFPAAVQDVKSAVRYIRANAGKYHLDPMHIAVWGKSAGGHLALMAGLSQGTEEFNDPKALATGTSDRVSAIISMYGPTDFLQMDAQLKDNGCPASDFTHNNVDSPESLYLGKKITTIPNIVARSNPISYLSPSSPWLMMLHGTKDCTVPPLQSKIMSDAAKKVLPLSKVHIRMEPDAGHGASIFDSEPVIKDVIIFLRTAFADANMITKK